MSSKSFLCSFKICALHYGQLVVSWLASTCWTHCLQPITDLQHLEMTSGGITGTTWQMQYLIAQPRWSHIEWGNAVFMVDFKLFSSPSILFLVFCSTRSQLFIAFITFNQAIKVCLQNTEIFSPAWHLPECHSCYNVMDQ